MKVVDIWVNLVPPQAFAEVLGEEAAGRVEGLFGAGVRSGTGAEELLEIMDSLDVETSVLTPGLFSGTEEMLAVADAHPGRFLVAPMVENARHPTDNARRIRDLSGHPRLAMVRVAPLVEQVPLNDRLLYPVYAACEELDLPVGVNVGVPGPPVRSRVQDPVLLEDLLVDFPRLVVIGAHMGHPYEELLITYMMKWPNLYLSNSAYLAKYMDPALVRFMNSSRGIGKVLFGSDHPILPLDRALAEAQALPLGEEAMAAFLGGSARRLLARSLG